MRRAVLKDLKRNLLAGMRLALFRPVRRLDFRVSPGQLVATAIFGAFCASLVDLAVLHGYAHFNAAGLGGHVRDIVLLLLLCGVVALWLRVTGGALAFTVVLLSAGWFTDLSFALILAVMTALGLNAWQTVPWWIVLVWSLIVAWRAVNVVLQGERRYGIARRSTAVALIFGATLAIALLFPAPRIWEERQSDAAADPALAKIPKVQSEEVMAAQPRLLFEALTNLEEREPGTTNVYFVGFAGDSSQDVFRNDMEAAQEIADDKLGTEGRSVVLINSPRTVLEVPLATVTNLRAALATIGRLIDVDEDIAFIYLSSHGSANHELYVNFPPLALQQLTPTSLSRLLQDSGIKWRVIIVSACFSGGYVEPLKDPYTIVMTSARADRTSFGCDNQADFTYFGQAYFQEALKKTDSYIEAFEMARAAIARREREEGLTPSEPQIFIGDAIGKKVGTKAKKTALVAELRR